MRMIPAALLACWAGGAGAESLCDVTDGVFDRLAGDWAGAVTASVETETLSVTDEVMPGLSTLSADGAFGIDFIQDLVGAGAVVRLTHGAVVHDVDGVDDLLDTTETAWMADALSDTPCGPEALPQLSGTVDHGPDLTGTLTLIAYFDDRVLMLSELEYRGDWGLAFVTAAALLEPLTD